MPIRPCPNCGQNTLRSLSMNDWALVNYYRCQSCGCVWTTPKTDPDAEPTVVVEGRRT